jgi:hypothetical protein
VSWAAFFGAVLGAVPRVIKLVRENTRKNVKGVGDHWHAIRGDGPNEWAAYRSPICSFCGLSKDDPQYLAPCRPTGELRT